MALTNVSIAIPDASGGASAWVASTLVDVTGVSIVGNYAPGDALTVYGAAVDAIPVQDGVIVGTVTVAVSGNLTVVLTARTWDSFPFLAAVRTGGTSTSLDLEVVGSDGGSGGGTDPMPVRETYQPGAVDNAQGGATRGVIGIANVPVSASKYGALVYANVGANVTQNIVARPVNILGIYCTNSNAAVRYIQIHNTKTVPNPGDATPLSFIVPPAVGGVPGVIMIGTDLLSVGGVALSLGAAFAFSTTDGLYTAALAANQSTRVVYTAP